MPTAHALILRLDAGALAREAELLATTGMRVTVTDGVEHAREQLLRDAFELVLVDLRADSVARSDQLRHDVIAAAGTTPVGFVTSTPLAAATLTASSVAFVLLRPFSDSALISAVSRAVDAPPLSPRRESVLRAYFACLERADWKHLETLCVPEVRYQLPGEHPALSRTVQGRDEFLAFTAATFDGFVEPRFAIRTTRSLPADVAVAHYDGSWRTGEGTRMSTSGTVRFQFEGDAIAEIGIHLDVAALA